MSWRGSWWLWASVLVAVIWACQKTGQSRFPHRVHLVGLECGTAGQPDCLSCLSCHQAEPGGEPGKPFQDACRECHASSASRMWETARRPKTTPAPIAHEIKFDHQRHLAMAEVKGQCTECHSGVVDAESTLFPPMERCFTCHEHQAQWDRNQCTPCHDSAEVRDLLPQTFMIHDHAWLRHHAFEGSTQGERCQTCHEQKSCDDCHAQSLGMMRELRRVDDVLSDVVHPADFITRHALEAQVDGAECLTCHTPPSCDGCHTQRGVSANRIDSRNPHPPGWVGGNPASMDFHGTAARRDILSCASCHDQGPATNCIDCHRVGGHGGNPHPSGWQSSRTPSATMCRYCHEG